jgi:hypothetical protein
MEIEDLLASWNGDVIGAIERTQTTFVELEIRSTLFPTRRFRIHFDGKQEIRLKVGTFQYITLSDEHPLLIDYCETTVDVHLDGFINEKLEFADALAKGARDTFGRWRAYERYMNMPLDQFLKRPYGVLLTSPKSFADRIVEFAPNFEVSIFTRNEHRPKGQFKVLCFDDLYVIAKDFRIELL